MEKKIDALFIRRSHSIALQMINLQTCYYFTGTVFEMRLNKRLLHIRLENKEYQAAKYEQFICKDDREKIKIILANQQDSQKAKQ